MDLFGRLGRFGRSRRAPSPPSELTPSSVPSARSASLDVETLRRAFSAGAHGVGQRVDLLLPELVRALRTGSPEVEASAADLLAGVDAATFVGLDHALRHDWRWAATDLPTPSTAAGLLDAVVRSWLADGHAREAAVARLDTFDHPVVLPALACRAADRVPQVRAPARAALLTRLSTSRAVVQIAPSAAVLAGRAHGGWLVGLLDERIAGLDDAEVGALLRAPDRWLRRRTFAVAAAADRFGLATLVATAALGGDVVLQRSAVAAAVRRARAEGRTDALRGLLTSRSAPVRAEVVWALAAAGDVAVATAALTDRAAVVRTVAQSAVRRTGVDPAEVYRAEFRHGRTTAWAVAGLGETGGRADRDLVAAGLDATPPRTRAAAVRALRRLGGPDLEAAVELLADPSPAVVREAVTALRGRAGEVSRAALDEALGAGRPAHVRRAAFRLLRARGPWERVAVDLQVYDDTDPALRAVARTDLATWLATDAATTWSQPSASEAARLAAFVDAAAPSLGESRAAALRFHAGFPRG